MTEIRSDRHTEKKKTQRKDKVWLKAKQNSTRQARLEDEQKSTQLTR